MAYAADTTRRSLFAMAGVAALLPAARQSLPEAPSSPWVRLIAALGPAHPDAPAALQRAIDIGVDPTSFTDIEVGSADAAQGRYPILFFGDLTLAYTVVTPTTAGAVTVFH